ncbi:WD repeat-containing protein 55-like [Tubulanus polymorphus]|uniref:WD repeat-containing protein 55-like n=1 Tax=Tubulanus polymorphus TaxID=672921 RepID=UPI003DA63469
MSASTSDMINVPKDIKFDDTCIVNDICFHTKKDVIAAGQIDGTVTIHSYSATENQTNHLLMTLSHHSKSCRSLRFSDDGEKLYTASKDKSIQIIDMGNGKTIKKMKKAHDSAIFCMEIIDDFKFATGDDDGNVKLWDIRQPEAIMAVKENEEFISALHIDKDKKILLAASGEGTLTAFNIRRKRMELQSELFDSEFLSLSVVKKQNKVLCGDGEGVMNIFNWGEWGNISDRFPGHPLSIDCMIAISDDIVCTGSMDGVIRAVHILPNRFLGVVGEHNDFPVENLSLSHDEKLLASCAHDGKIKFWNVEDVKTEIVDTKKKAKKNTKTKSLNTSSAAKNSDFFSDLVENKDNDDDDDGDDDTDSEDSDD